MSVIISSSEYKVKIKNEVIEVMKSYKQLKTTDYESGGMLIGYEVLNGDVIIEYATTPYSRDKRSRYSFHRKDKKHNNVLKTIWEKECQIHIYIGEWHTHPENYPDYSKQDEKNWIQIGGKMDKKKFIHIIVGNKSIGVWEYNFENGIILKIGEIKCGIN